MQKTQARWDRVRTLLSTSRQRTYTGGLAELTDLCTLLVSLQTREGRRKAVRAALPLLAYAVGYVIAQFASAKLAYAMSPRIAGPSPLFIHGGVAISALLLALPRRWWRYLLLTFPLILIDAWWLGLLSAPTNWWVIVVAYLQVVIMAVVTAGLLRRFANVPLRFATVGEVGRFLAIVAIGVVPASLFSTAARYYIWSLDFWFAWRTAYLGFVLGIMTFMPAIVLWTTDAPRNLNLVRRGQQTEAMLLGLAIVIVSVLVFGTRLQDQVLAYALIYILVPVLIWAAVRFGPFGLASTLALSALIAVTSAVNNRGPFVASSAPDNVLALQLFFLCIGVPLLFLAALVQERKQADTAIRTSEARYRAMFHSAAIGVAVTDLDGRPLEVNEYASQMLGYAPDELRTLALRDFTHPDDVADNEALLRRALEGDIGSYQLEKRYLHKDGHSVWGRLSASLVRSQDGHPAYFVVHLEDVTQRKQLEHERDEQAAQLAALQEVSDTALTHLGLDDVLQAVLDRIHGVLGLEHAAIRLLEADGKTLGLPTASGYDWLLAASSPLELGQGFAGRIGASREPLVVDDMTGFPVVDPAKGAQLCSAVGVPLLLDGRLLGVLYSGSMTPRHFTGYEVRLLQLLADRVAVAVDRARLFEAERTARADAEQRREELDRVFEQTTEALFIYDTEGRLVRGNAAQRRLLAKDAEPPGHEQLPLAKRMKTYQLLDEDGHTVAVEQSPVMRALQGEMVSGLDAMDLQMRVWDGRVLDVSASAAPLRDREGRIIGAVAVLRDQTERKRLEREREEARVQAERRAEELDRVFEAMADGVAVYDQDGREVRTNTALQRLFRTDLAPPEYGVLSMHERMALFAARDEQGRPLTTDEGPLPSALRGEIASGSASMDIRSRAFDGRELELSVSAAPLRDGAGRVTGAVALFRDQTERRQLEREREAARAEAERQAAELAATFEAMADGVAVFDTQGQLVRENAALHRLLGADPAAPDYATLSLSQQMELLAVHDEHGPLRNPTAGPLPRALVGELVGGAQTRNIGLRTLDGRDIEVGVSAAPLRDRQGEVAGAVVVLRDQTERNQLLRDRAEQAEQLDRIVEQMTEPLVVQDAAGRVVRVNAAMRRLIVSDTLPSGFEEVPLRDRVALYAMRDTQGHPLAPEDSPNMRALRGEVLTGEQAMDVRLQTPDGREAEVRISAAPLHDREGRIVGAVGVGVDLTERNQLAREREAALALAQARSAELEAVLGAMTDGVVVYDATAHITYTNAAFRTLFGVDTRPDYARLSLAERNALVHARTPDGRDLPEDQLPQTRVLRGEVLPSGAAAPDLRGDTVDGRKLTLQLAGGPLRDADGTVTGAVLVFRDVTAQRHLESTTRELAAQLQATLDAMTDAVFLYGDDGQVLRLNTAAQALVDAEPDFPTIAGTGWWDRVKRYHPRRPDGRPLSLEEWPLARVLRGETITAVEVQDVVLTDAQGGDQVLNYVGGPARDAEGKLMGYVFVVRDVTERRRLQHEWEEARANELALREVNQRLDTFVAMAAHDLRSPVGVSRMVVQRVQQQLLQATAGADGRSGQGKPAQALIRASQGVDTIAHNLNRLMRLVQQLLDVSRVKEGTLVLQRQPVDLAELVRTCVDEQRLLNPSRVIAVELPDPATGGTAPIVVDADPDRLSQVLTNYLTNAVRYSPDDTSIEVGLQIVTPTSADVGDPIVRVTVRDHGPGIPLEEQATIWERFQRARTVREAAGGLGLGLYIARTISELHGGQVGVESPPGEGATFWFTLPLAPGPAAV